MFLLWFCRYFLCLFAFWLPESFVCLISQEVLRICVSQFWAVTANLEKTRSLYGNRRNRNIIPKSSQGHRPWLCAQGIQMWNIAPSSSLSPNRCLNSCHPILEHWESPWDFPLTGRKHTVSYIIYCLVVLKDSKFSVLKGALSSGPHLASHSSLASSSHFPYWPLAMFMIGSPMAPCQDYLILSLAFDPVGILYFRTSLCFSLLLCHFLLDICSVSFANVSTSLPKEKKKNSRNSLYQTKYVPKCSCFYLEKHLVLGLRHNKELDKLE